MAFVLIPWVSISSLFCLALVRAAARRRLPSSEAAQLEVTGVVEDSIVVDTLQEPQTVSATTLS